MKKVLILLSLALITSCSFKHSGKYEAVTDQDGRPVPMYLVFNVEDDTISSVTSIFNRVEFSTSYDDFCKGIRMIRPADRSHELVFVGDSMFIPFTADNKVFSIKCKKQ